MTPIEWIRTRALTALLCFRRSADIGPGTGSEKEKKPESPCRNVSSWENILSSSGHTNTPCRWILGPKLVAADGGPDAPSVAHAAVATVWFGSQTFADHVKNTRASWSENETARLARCGDSDAFSPFCLQALPQYICFALFYFTALTFSIHLRYPTRATCLKSVARSWK